MNLKLLWASPLPPTPSGVSEYAVEMIEALSKLVELRILRPPGQGDSTPLEGAEVVKDIGDRKPGEILVAHLGNNPYHEWIMPLCSRPAAVVVMHDLVLHHLLVEHTAARGDLEAIENALQVEYGSAGRALADARKYGIQGRLDAFLFPALKSVVGKAAAFMTHSKFGLERLTNTFPDKPCRRIPLPVADPGEVDSKEMRARLQIPEEDILLMHLGFLSREKGLGTILRAVAAARRLGLLVHLVIVGGKGGLGEAEELVSALGMDAFVTATGWLEHEEMMHIPAAADLGVVLREPSAGETSAAVLRFLASGTPVGVIGSHQYLEWPEEIAPRISPGAASEVDIIRLLERVALEKEQGSWEGRRRQARRYFLGSHRPQDAAEQMVDFLSSLSF